MRLAGQRAERKQWGVITTWVDWPDGATGENEKIITLVQTISYWSRHSSSIGIDNELDINNVINITV